MSEGRRIRRDGSTFRAHITLTALRSVDGTLLGFAKVTRDITGRQEAAAATSQSEREALAAEVEVLKEELAVLREELRARDRPTSD